MDYAIAVEWFFRSQYPGESPEFGLATDFATLAATWRDRHPLPTQRQLEAAYVDWLASRPALESDDFLNQLSWLVQNVQSTADRYETWFPLTMHMLQAVLTTNRPPDYPTASDNAAAIAAIIANDPDASAFVGQVYTFLMALDEPARWQFVSTALAVLTAMMQISYAYTFNLAAPPDVS